MVSQARRGSQIQMLCLTDGSAGHQHLSRSELATRRAAEAARAADLIGAEVRIWEVADGELTPSLDLRARLIADIRHFAPDLLITHRLQDYHPDHRATAQLVQDACYLLRVPNVVPEVAALHRDPVVLGMADFFTRPAPFQADVVLPVDAVFEQVVDLLACHESQVFEWLPFMDGQEEALRAGDRRDWLTRYYGRRPAAIARRWAPAHHYAEAFEISEYGRRLPAADIQRRLGVPELA